MDRRASSAEDEFDDDDDDPLAKEMHKVHDDDQHDDDDDDDDDDLEDETPGKSAAASSSTAGSSNKNFIDDPVDFLFPLFVRQRIASVFGYTMQGIQTLGNIMWFGSTTAMVLLIPIYYVFTLATAAGTFTLEPDRRTQHDYMHPHSTLGPPNELDTFGVAAGDAAEGAAAGLRNTVRPNPNLPNSS